MKNALNDDEIQNIINIQKLYQIIYNEYNKCKNNILISIR